jgi:hypothetical protein
MFWIWKFVAGTDSKLAVAIVLAQPGVDYIAAVRCGSKGGVFVTAHLELRN